MWHTVPKFHTSKHLAASFKLGKPKFSWCFRHEHFCGRMATLGHSCSCGTKSLALSTKITGKYKLLMFIRQWQTREWEKVCKAAAICGRSTAEVFLWNIYMLHLWKNVNVQHNWMKYQYFGHKISIFEVRFYSKISIFQDHTWIVKNKAWNRRSIPKNIDIPGYENIDFFESPTLRDLPRYLARP